MMTEANKKLLLIELCARLPYGVQIHYHWSREGNTIDEDRELDFSDVETLKYNIENPQNDWCEISWKPYLRPISSMTDEEMDKLFDILNIDKGGEDEDWIKINDVLGIKFFFPTGKWVEHVALAYDYLYSIHLDFRGLIPLGLAFPAPDGMYV